MKHLVTLLIIVSAGWTVHAQSAGNALHYDGANDYVSCPIPAVFTNVAANDFTVEAWVKPTGSATQRIFFAQQSSSMYVSILLNTSNVPYIYIGTGTSSIGLSASAGLTSGQWSHVAITWDASASQASMFVNGIQQNLSSGGSTSGGPLGLMAIGSKTDGTQNLIGALDEFRIWSEVRTVCQINTNMHHAAVGDEPNLVSYYDFNQGTAGNDNTGITALPDLAGSNNGTLNNFALMGNTSNWVVSEVAIMGLGAGQVLITDTTYMSICEGDTILFAGNDVFDSGIYLSGTHPSVLGCDSVHVLNLTVNDHALNIVTQNACDMYDFNGELLTESGIYYDTLVSAMGCDSIIQLNLTIHTVDVDVTQSGVNLTANAAGASYQWLDCNQDFAPVSGATGATYIASANGSYAVAVTQNGCSDTSACFLVTTVSMDENALSPINIYPNPAKDFITLSGIAGNGVEKISVMDVQGRLLFFLNHVALPAQIDIHALPSGIYLIHIDEAAGRRTLRLIKE